MDDILVLERDSELVLGLLLVLELGTALGFACRSDPSLCFGLDLELLFDDSFGMFEEFLASRLELVLKTSPCLEFEMCLGCSCSLSLVFKLVVAWETAAGKFVLDL